MRGRDWLRIVARLEKEAGQVKYGRVGVSVQLHNGEVCKIRYTREESVAVPAGGYGAENGEDARQIGFLAQGAT